MRDGLVVVGGSAGALPPLIDLVAGLPADFAGRVVVVLHVPERGHSNLATILDRSGPLPAVAARDGVALTRAASTSPSPTPTSSSPTVSWC